MIPKVSVLLGAVLLQERLERLGNGWG